jgi:hypothetical protein
MAGLNIITHDLFIYYLNSIFILFRKLKITPATPAPKYKNNNLKFLLKNTLKTYFIINI